MRPSTSLSILFLLILATSSLLAQEKKKEPPRPTLRQYLETLDQFLPREFEASGMEITTTVVPDLYLYGLAKSLELAQRNGWNEEKTEKHLRKEYRRIKREKDRMRVRIEITSNSRKDHLFLQKKLKGHVKVEGEGKVSGASDGAPKPRYNKWQVIQGASIKRFTFARYEKLSFEVTIKKKSSEVCTLQLVDLLHYFEAPKKSEFETTGINVGARQISLGSIRDMMVDPVSIELAPATWKAPLLPEELEAWKKKLELK